jgi:hypothetical protein
LATFTLKQLAIKGNDSYLSHHVFRHAEAASQTFARMAPVIFASGYMQTAAEPVAVKTLVGFAVRAGRNGTAGQYQTEYVQAFPGMLLYINKMVDNGTTHTLAQADFGKIYQMHVISGIHHLGNSVTTPAGFQLMSGQNDQVLSGASARPNTDAIAGDVDARVLCKVLGGMLDNGVYA